MPGRNSACSTVVPPDTKIAAALRSGLASTANATPRSGSTAASGEHTAAHTSAGNTRSVAFVAMFPNARRRSSYRGTRLIAWRIVASDCVKPSAGIHRDQCAGLSSSQPSGIDHSKYAVPSRAPVSTANRPRSTAAFNATLASVPAVEAMNI